MRRQSAELVVHMPKGMEIAFERVHSIANVAVSLSDNPSSIEERGSSDFLELPSGHSFEHILPLLSLLVERGESPFRDGAQQRFTQIVHLEVPTVLARRCSERVTRRNGEVNKHLRVTFRSELPTCLNREEPVALYWGLSSDHFRQQCSTYESAPKIRCESPAAHTVLTRW